MKGRENLLDAGTRSGRNGSGRCRERLDLGVGPARRVESPCSRDHCDHMREFVVKATRTTILGLDPIDHGIPRVSGVAIPVFWADPMLLATALGPVIPRSVDEAVRSHDNSAAGR
jgi:hypothetical protein